MFIDPRAVRIVKIFDVARAALIPINESCVSSDWLAVHAGVVTRHWRNASMAIEAMLRDERVLMKEDRRCE